MKTYSLLLLASLFALSIVFSGCYEEDEADKNGRADCLNQATFQDFTGLDGCGFLLILQDGQSEERLEAVNLADFDVVPTEGMEVCIDFTDATDAASICMAGRLIELQSIVQVEE